MKRNLIIWISLVVVTLGSCRKEKLASVDTPVKYFPIVKSIIQTNCTITCHSPSKGFYQGLPTILENDSDIVKSAAAIKKAVTGPFNFFNKQMPLGGHLSQAEIDTIGMWVDKGGRATD